MKPENVTKVISTISVIFVFLLTLGAFTLSYNALWDVASTYGIPAQLSWVWPLLVDGAIVVFALAVVRASLLGEKTKILWAMVLSFTGATIFFNILHSDLGAVSIIVAIIAPIALVLSFETLMANLRNHVERSGIIQSIADLGEQLAQKRQDLGDLVAKKQNEIDNLQSRVDNLNRQYQTIEGKLTDYNRLIDEKKAELKRLSDGAIKAYVPDNLTIEQRQLLVNQMDNDGQTIGQMAEVLGVSEGTIKNDKKAIRGQTVIDIVDIPRTTGGQNGN